MKLKNIMSFIGGIFENAGAESRIPDNGLVKLHNVDITDDARLVRRRGYQYWSDLKANASTSGGIPNTDRGGFPRRVQAVKGWTDVAGNEYVFVVCDGKVYIEQYDGTTKRWTCINPTGRIDLFQREKHIDIVSYLDVVFFNDVGKNVYMYNSASYTSGGYNILGARFIYFAGDKIYYRKQSDYTADDTIQIEDNTANLSGKIIYDGLHNIGFIGVTGPVQNAADLKLGYSLRVGNDDIGYSYIVLENAKNQRGTDMVYLIQFNDRFIAQDYIGLAMDPAGEILSFAHRYDNVEYKDYAYVFARDGEIDVIDLGNFSSTVLDSATGAGAMVAPTVQSGKKQYSICLNGNGLFVYSSKVPALTDWWQPIILDEFNFSAISDFTNSNIPDDPTESSEILFAKDLVSAVEQSITHNNHILISPSGTYFNFASSFPLTSGPHNTQHDVLIGGGNVYKSSEYLGPKGDTGSPLFMYYRQRATYSDIITNTYSRYDVYAGSRFVDNVIAVPQKIINVYDIKNILAADLLDSGIITVADYDFASGINDLTNLIAGYLYAPGDQTINILILGNRYPAKMVQFYSALYGYPSAGYYASQYYSTPNHDVVWTMPGDPGYVAPTDRIMNLQSEAVSYDLANKKISFSNDFCYNKSAAVPANKQIWAYDNTDLVTYGSHLYLGSYSIPIIGDVPVFDASVFTDITTSKHALLVGLTLAGELLERSLSGFITGTHKWRYMFPLGLIADTVDLVPIQSYGDELHFGTSMEQVSGTDNGIYMKLNLATLEYMTEAMNTSCRKMIVDDARELLYLMRGDPDVAGDIARFRFNSAWDWNTGGSVFTDFTDLLDFNSNVTYAIVKQIASESGGSVIDRLQYVGTPRAPFVTVDNAAANNLAKGTRFIYQTAFRFAIKTTVLSSDSEEIVIPDIGADPQPVKMIISGIDHKNALGVELYDKADITEIQVYRRQLADGGTVWSDPLLVNYLTKDADGKWFVGGDAHTFAEGVVEDNDQSIAYSPFTQGNVLKYAVEDICVHKGRLILVNLVDELNTSVLMYSDQDLAEAIPPGNVRAIESGDGDRLYSGESCGDYLYLFKSKKMYAILGDVLNGQLINISNTVGCRHKNLIAQYMDTVYFLDDSGPYMVRGSQCVPLMQENVKNYFDIYRNDCIDFLHMQDNGFAAIDAARMEIRFHVPVKVDGRAQITNNHVLIYNIRYGYWKTYSYSDGVFIESQIKDIASFAYKTLISDYDGDIFELSAQKNDNGKPVKFIIRTKDFNLGTDLLAKSYKLLKLYGKNMRGMRITYWVDGTQMAGDVSWSPGLKDEATVRVWKRGRCNTIMIEISGEAQNHPPVEINEILIGYDRLAGIR